MSKITDSLKHISQGTEKIQERTHNIENLIAGRELETEPDLVYTDINEVMFDDQKISNDTDHILLEDGSEKPHALLDEESQLVEAEVVSNDVAIIEEDQPPNDTLAQGQVERWSDIPNIVFIKLIKVGGGTFRYWVMYPLSIKYGKEALANRGSSPHVVCDDHLLTTQTKYFHRRT
eukprot:UN27470